MDWNKLQHTLFALDPSDPAEDLRKLRESASRANNIAPTKDYVVESVEIAQGSMPVDGNYSIADFAALAGVTLTEAQKKGSAGQLKGKDAIKKLPAGTTKNATRDKLVGEDWKDSIKRGWDNYNSPAAVGIENPIKKIFNPTGKDTTKSADTNKTSAVKKSNYKVPTGDWKGFLKQYTAQLQVIVNDPKKKAEFDKFMLTMEESVQEAPMPKPPKARDPNWRQMDGIRKSGAGGAHKNKAEVLPRKEKHKGKKEYTTESIKEMLYRKLNESK
jgi:hypothetical protein